MNKYRVILVCILEVAGMSSLIYVLKKITDAGIYADKTGTSGHVTIPEIALLLMALLFVVASIILVLFGLDNDAPNGVRERSQSQKKFKFLTLLTLIFSVSSMLAYFLTPVTILVGLWATFVSNHNDNSGWKNLRAYRFITLFAVVMSLINFAIVLTTK